jgi:hypothetical protein
MAVKKSHAAKTISAKSKKPTRSKSAASSLPFKPVAPPRPLIESSQPTAPAPTATLADVKAAYAAPAKKSAANALGDPTQTLQTFTLGELAQFTKEQTYSTNASKDVHLFYVGRDDVHDILKYVLSRVTVSLYLNMFGYDDDELNNILMTKALDPAVTMLITLDKSQASGVHEKALIAADEKYNLAAYNTHFVTGQSATHQISHTKGFVADGRVAAEGSTNWSNSGEGTFVVTGQPGGSGYEAQNNTQSIITDPDTINRFQTELIAEHLTAAAQAKAAGTAKQKPPVVTKATVATKKPATKKSVAKKSAPKKKS